MEILQQTNADKWHHVRSSYNPADIVSRGVDPAKLLKHKLWQKSKVYVTNEETRKTVASLVQCDVHSRMQKLNFFVTSQ